MAALAEANRRGWYRATHRVSAPQRALRQILCSRRQLVSMRSGTISVLRALLRQAGYRLAAGSAERVPTRLARLSLPEDLAATLIPLRRIVEALSEAIATVDARLRAHVGTDPVVQRLQSVPGVGPIVALCTANS